MSTRMRTLAKAGVPAWHANQLRHAFGTHIRAAFGIEGAQHGLGHTRASTSEIYAEKGLALAMRIAAELG